MEDNSKSKSIPWAVLCCLAICLACVPACGGARPVATTQRVVDVGMLLAKGGLGDRSFNDSAYAGLQQAQRQYGIRFETADFTSDEANLESLRGFARRGFGLVVAVGYENAGYIETVAGEYPSVPFAIIDSAAKGDNVASVTYREQEGDFLMGVLAASLTRTRKVGFIGGVDIDAVRRIESGFYQGVAFEDNAVEVVSDFAGSFADPEAGKRLALKQYGSGVDVIYNAAGRTGMGIIEAATETDKLTIGTSGDQRYLAPGNVVGNRPKRVDTAVLVLVGEVVEGGFAAGVRSLGLTEGGLSIGPFDENLVPRSTIDRLESLRRDVENGKIVVKERMGE